jgi:hypothetical protein
MRTAAICPTCATYENALCIIYNGPYLTNLDIVPLESIQEILVKIDANFVPTTGITASINSAIYLGQQHLDTDINQLYSAKTIGFGAADWELVIKVPLTGAPEFANNADAIVAGLTIGKVYRTGDLLKIVH